MTFIAKKLSRQRPSAPVVGGRWSRWAQSMSGRHRQVVSKHRFVVMTLLRRSLPLYFSSHRWELKAWSVFPRIKLAIDVRPQPFGLRTSLFSQARPQVDRQHDREVMRFVERTDNKTAMGSEAIVVAPSLSVSDLYGRRALDRVFLRLNSHDSEVRSKKILSAEALHIVHRITDERRRVEDRRETPAVLRRRRPASLSQEQMNEIVEKSANQVSALDRYGSNIRNADAMPMPFATPNFNLQQLTDHVIRQIDDRIIAHKERMGKLF
jgi:hypothetical protein